MTGFSRHSARRAMFWGLPGMLSPSRDVTRQASWPKRLKDKAMGPEPKTVDLFVIGGGINGAGIARDAAGRGLSVLLCEQHDLAQHTSSASTKLIHGGLR